MSGRPRRSRHPRPRLPEVEVVEVLALLDAGFTPRGIEAVVDRLSVLGASFEEGLIELPDVVALALAGAR